ncbi:MAG: VWA domain-containing protein [Pyrinomonadaceae bacterium]|nr:VWA domain-containing protein [Pyrinomonadaceae bacterium]
MNRCLTIATVFILILTLSGFGQSRRNNRGDSIEGTVLSVIASRADKNSGPIRVEDLFLYENGVEQRIKNFAPDPSPSRIMILVDNSQTLPAPIETLKKAVMEFAYEIFEGDQLFVLAYDEKAEIVQEWTDDAKKIQASLETFRKKGNPNLFDALEISMKEVLLPLMPGTRKTAVVLVGDGVDRGSKATFDKVLADYQNQDVTIYALQLADRTGGAYRRDQPKATAVMTRLAEETGGKVFPFEEAQAAAKAICDELRANRYLLSYLPTNATSFDSRRLLLTASDGISIRMKAVQPPNIK